MLQFKFKEWPLEPQEVATLRWFRSPWKDPVTYDWLVTAVFQRQSGEYIDVMYDWSAFPGPHLGISFQDAEGVGAIYYRYADLIQLNFGPTVLYKVVKAYEIDELQTHWIQGQENLEEYVILMESETLGKRLILPMLVYIQFCLTPSRYLALGILEPNYFERYIRNHYVAENTFFLELLADAPKNILRIEVQRIIAKLLYIPRFRAIWNAVRRERFLTAQKQSSSVNIPLITHLPDKVGSFINAFGINIGSSRLIWRLMRLDFDMPLPFSQVVVTHPRFKAPKQVTLYGSSQPKPLNPTTQVIRVS